MTPTFTWNTTEVKVCMRPQPPSIH